jgi:type I restriction enzyme S subunit
MSLAPYPELKLKFVARLNMGQSPPAGSVNAESDGLPFLQGNGEFGELSPTPRLWSRAAPKRCQPGDLLLSVRAPVGAFNVADQTYGIGRGLCAIRPVRLQPRFLWHAMPLLRDRLAGLGLGSTYDAVALDDVSNLPVPVPPDGVQTALVAFLDEEVGRLDELVRLKRRLRTLLVERRTSVMYQAVSGRLRSPPHERRAAADVPWLDSVPVNWEEVKLTHVAKLGSGHTPSRSRPEYWEDCTIPWITTGEVAQVRDDRREVITQTRERISELGLRHSSAVIHPRDTVVLCRTAASAGYSALMGAPMATSQDFATWTCSDRLVPRFLLYCLRAMRSDLLGRLAMGSTHRTIYMPDIQALRIPLPPVSEQQSLVDRARREFDLMDGLLDRVDSQLLLLDERRHTLLRAAVTGALDPGVYGDAVAA